MVRKKPRKLSRREFVRDAGAALALTTLPASVLMGWAFLRRIRDFEEGRRELPEVDAAVSH